MSVSFKEKVYILAGAIPSGKVATYGQLAALAGNAKAARAVGVIMKHNHNPLLIPCHRVVASNGALTGYSLGKGISSKKELLKKEGVVFRGQRVNLLKSQWKRHI